MNYFGHARLAAAHRDEPHFVLGAMLPDWLAWVGDLLAHVAHPALADGIAFHQRSDAAFHASARFVSLVRDATAHLRDAGLERGPARGAAHVGIELLLDGVLLRGEAGRRAYASALAVAGPASRHLAWRRPGSAERFEALARRLADEGLPRRYADPERVAEAVSRTLSRRPRLRVAPGDLPALARWARGAAPRVAREAPGLLAETEAGMRERAVA